MKIVVPFTIVQPKLKNYLKPYKAQYIKMVKIDDYPKLLGKKFKEGKKFINIEHDVVPWQGALEQIWDCSEEWCAFGYSKLDNFDDPNGAIYLGCVKFGEKLIRELKNIWDYMPEKDWNYCDIYFARIARKYFKPHRHQPNVEHLRSIKSYRLFPQDI